MKVLVTGGAGFLGSHLCELLISKGDEVLCVDNLHTGSESNIADLKKNKNFKLVYSKINKKSSEISSLTIFVTLIYVRFSSNEIKFIKRKREREADDRTNFI